MGSSGWSMGRNGPRTATSSRTYMRSDAHAGPEEVCMLSHAWCIGRCPNKDRRDIKPTEHPFLVPHRVFHTTNNTSQNVRYYSYVSTSLSYKPLNSLDRFVQFNILPLVDLEGHFAVLLSNPSGHPHVAVGQLFRNIC